jgi:thymidylate synthase
MRDPSGSAAALHVLVVAQGTWGERIAGNIHDHAPTDWHVETWSAPRAIPPVVDYPEDYLPPSFQAADLVVALCETAGLAQIIPDVVRLSGAKAVIAPVDFNEALPPGLIRQLTRWVNQEGAEIIFPKPFCSLTPTTYNRTPLVRTYDHPVIRAFAERFGRPSFEIKVAEGRIAAVEVGREAACGCSQGVAEGLIGRPVDKAVEAAGMLHHHFPCLASMNQDPDYHDTLMHVSGDAFRDAVKDEIRTFLKPTPYLRPSGRVETPGPAQGE